MAEILTIIAKQFGDLTIKNDVGGTHWMPAGTYQLRVVNHFSDSEIGERGIGELLSPDDIETARKVGTTAPLPTHLPYTEHKPYFDWNPAICYFDYDQAKRDTDTVLLKLAEQALGENLQWITDQADLGVRQKDAETLRRLKQLNDAWVTIAKALKGRE
jgi:hypothetical protein